MFENENNFVVKRDNPLNLRSTARFRLSTTADLERLSNLYRNSMYNFVTIFANSEIMVYKICNFLADNFGLQKTQVKFLDGLVLESYFDISAKHQYNMIKLEHLLKEGSLRDIGGKWLIIPNMTSTWTPKLAQYFLEEVKNAGCLGIIFHASGMDNFGQILVQHADVGTIEFPEQLYKIIRELEDDGF